MHDALRISRLEVLLIRFSSIVNSHPFPFPDNDRAYCKAKDVILEPAAIATYCFPFTS